MLRPTFSSRDPQGGVRWHGSSKQRRRRSHTKALVTMAHWTDNLQEGIRPSRQRTPQQDRTNKPRQECTCLLELTVILCDGCASSVRNVESWGPPCAAGSGRHSHCQGGVGCHTDRIRIRGDGIRYV